jgi:hypothetical protein
VEVVKAGAAAANGSAVASMRFDLVWLGGGSGLPVRFDSGTRWRRALVGKGGRYSARWWVRGRRKGPRVWGVGTGQPREARASEPPTPLSCRGRGAVCVSFRRARGGDEPSFPADGQGA